MKKIKKVMALLLAMAMIIGTLSVLVSAESTGRDEIVKVTGLADGDKVEFYQVLEWAPQIEVDGELVDNPNAYQGWALKAPFTSLTTSDGKTGKAAVEVLAVGVTAENAGLIKAIALAAKNADPATVTPTVVNAANGEASLDISADKVGMYLALPVPADKKTMYNAVFVSADYNDTNKSNLWDITSKATYQNEAAAKKSTVSITKEDEKGDNSYDLTWRSVRPGETVKYTVKTTIPGYGPVFEHPHFVVKDKLTDLKLVAAPTITKPENLPAANYSISGGANDTEFTVTFTEAYLKTVSAPTEVEITYEAEVTTPEKFWNVNREDNEVWVEFNHDPTDESDFEYEKDDTYHYTYTIDADLVGGYGEELLKSGTEIVKIGLMPDGKTPITSTKTTSVISSTSYQEGPLEAAEFKLYTDEACTNEYKDAKGNSYTLKSDASGRIKIEGLDATNETSVYYLKETKAPAGFIKDPRAIKIEIVPTFATENFTMWTNGSVWSDTKVDDTYKWSSDYSAEVLKEYTVFINGKKASNYHFKNDGGKTMKWVKGSSSELPSSIVNTQGVELPSTGGVGTTIFYLVGAILVVGAGVVLVTRRRVSSLK